MSRVEPGQRVRAPVAAPRTVTPVLLWAALGIIGIAVAAWTFTAWIVSGQARPVGTGADRVPTVATVFAAVFQIGGPLAALAVITYVVRRCVREHRLVLDAMILIGTALAWWHDPLINWLRPVVFYNATLVNAGSWTEQFPGWSSPNGRHLPEPILMIGVSYLWMPLLLGMLGSTAMRAARDRRPDLNAVTVFCAGWAAVLVVEFPLEYVAVRSGLVAYPASIRALTLSPGDIHQLPLYGPLLWSLVLTAVGALRFFVDDEGRSTVERGADRLDPRRRTRWRMLAVIGFVQVVAVVGYDLPMILAGTRAGPTDTYPTYLRTTQCGPDTATACPGH